MAFGPAQGSAPWGLAISLVVGFRLRDDNDLELGFRAVKRQTQGQGAVAAGLLCDVDRLHGFSPVDGGSSSFYPVTRSIVSWPTRKLNRRAPWVNSGGAGPQQRPDWAAGACGRMRRQIFAWIED